MEKIEDLVDGLIYDCELATKVCVRNPTSLIRADRLSKVVG